MTTQDAEIIGRMKQFGGSFVKALAEAAMRADDDNLRRIKECWPDYWFRYSFAPPVNHHAAAILESKPMLEYTGED